MKYLRFLLLFGFVAPLGMTVVPAQSQTSTIARYSNVWRSISDQGIRDGIRLNRTNGVGLEQIMMRALLQQKGVAYLSAIKAASDAEPKNGTLLAAYAWALIQTRNSYRFKADSQEVPAEFSQFNFGEQYLLDTIQRSKELDSHNWLAYIVEASLNPGGLVGRPTQEASAAKKAMAIQRNALTLTTYGSNLLFQSAGMYSINPQRSKRQSQESLRLLLLSQKLYPTHYRINYEIYCAYGYPLVINKKNRGKHCANSTITFHLNLENCHG